MEPEPAFALDIEGDRVVLAPARSGLTILVGSERVGEVSLEQEGGVLVVRQLRIEDRRRGRGLGSDAGRALLRAAADAGRWSAVRAAVPADRGLGVYFWSRMGLRPLHGEGPDGGIWLQRDVSEASPGASPSGA
ncbi:MAG: hypothetical protein WEC33_00830 [Dehalococcoidia bacterium]